jgi:hypothetical protein
MWLGKYSLQCYNHRRFISAIISSVNHQWWPIAVELVVASSVIVYSVIIKSEVFRDQNAVVGLPSFLVPMFFHLYFSGIIIWASLQISIIERIEMRKHFFSQMPILISMGTALAVGTFILHRKAIKINIPVKI